MKDLISHMKRGVFLSNGREQRHHMIPAQEGMADGEWSKALYGGENP